MTKRTILFTTLALLAAAVPTVLTAQDIHVAVAAGNMDDSRDSHFNWSFQSSGGGSAQVGQFACGSYWVAPAEGDTGVTLLSLGGNPDWNDFVSCDADPIPERHGLLDGANNYGSYDGSENIIPDLPLTFTAPDGSCISLVAAMQRNEAETSPGGTDRIEGEVADAYCVVTILPTAPDNGGSNMIRPNITGASKEILTWDDFDLSRIPTYGFLAGNSTQGWQNAQKRWRSAIEIFGGFEAEVTPGNWQSFSEGGRAFRAHNVVPDYGSGMAQSYYQDMLAVFSAADTLEEKKGALAAMLSYGLDIYHARYNYGTAARKRWLSGAGQQPGKFMPAVFLASLLKDESKAHELRKVAIHTHGEDPAELGPQELRQLNRGVTGVILWGDGTPFNRTGNDVIEEDRRYWSNLRAAACFDTAIGTCKPDAGKRTIADPYGYIDGPAESPGTSYMGVSFGNFRALAAVMILMPEIRSIVNTDAPIEYADRYVRHGLWTFPDPVAPVSLADQTNDCDAWRWGAGCSEYGITWGPRPEDVRFAIEDGTGRFHSKHGTGGGSGGYEASRAKDQWANIIALYDGPTFEDNAVPLGTLPAPEIFFETGSSPKAHLKSRTYDVEIRYTIDGTDPSASSALYTGPVPVIAGMEVRAKAFKEGMTESAVRQRTYDFAAPEPDDEAPTVPNGLNISNVGPTSIDLTWSPATDNKGVAGYKVFANGSYIISVSSTNARLSGLTPSTNYSIAISAYDAAGNESALSTSANATTQEAGTPVNPVVVAVSFSSEQSGNEAENTVDGDLGTRWAAAGDPQWLIWELDQDYLISAVELAFHQGASRNYLFDIETSLDGVAWTTVFSGQSSGVGDAMESFALPGDNVRYVRYVGHGSTANTWNSITEAAFIAMEQPVQTWGGNAVMENGTVHTSSSLGWIFLYPESSWAWSYQIERLIFAPDPGPGAAGFWFFMPH